MNETQQLFPLTLLELMNLVNRGLTIREQEKAIWRAVFPPVFLFFCNPAPSKPGLIGSWSLAGSKGKLIHDPILEQVNTRLLVLIHSL